MENPESQEKKYISFKELKKSSENLSTKKICNFIKDNGLDCYYKNSNSNKLTKVESIKYPLNEEDFDMSYNSKFQECLSSLINKADSYNMDAPSPATLEAAQKEINKRAIFSVKMKDDNLAIYFSEYIYKRDLKRVYFKSNDIQKVLNDLGYASNNVEEIGDALYSAFIEIKNLAIEFRDKQMSDIIDRKTEEMNKKRSLEGNLFLKKPLSIDKQDIMDWLSDKNPDLRQRQRDYYADLIMRTLKLQKRSGTKAYK